MFGSGLLETLDGISCNLRGREGESWWERMETVKRRGKQRETLKGQTRPRIGHPEKKGEKKGMKRRREWEREMKRGWKSSSVKWDWAAEGRGEDWKKMRGSIKERGRKKVAKEGGREGEEKDKLQAERWKRRFGEKSKNKTRRFWKQRDGRDGYLVGGGGSWSVRGSGPQEV